MDKKMRFEEFTQAVVDQIREYLPIGFANAAIELQTVVKNNDMKLTGLTIRSVDSNISPTIYLEQFYDRYKEGAEIGRVLEDIADVRVRHELKESFDVEQITDFEEVKDRIVPKLIHKGWNEALLADRPYTEVADLAVIYQIMLKHDFDGNAVVTVTNQLMNEWNTTVEELHELAVRNMTRLNPNSIQSMSAVLSEMLGEAETNGLIEQLPEDELMFVISNRNKINAAAAILDRGLMTSIVKKLGSFLLIPSSVHEWILVRNTEDMDIQTISAMINEVNAEQVAVDDRLSDHPYRYSLEEGLLSV